MVHGHGKIILFGEHAVVFGYPALAVAVERGIELSWERASGPTTELSISPGDTRVDTGSQPCAEHPLLQQALKIARAMYDDSLELRLRAQARIPKGAGVGSSAALGVAVLRAMDEARGIQRSNDEIFERSFAWERVFHGTPGGVDNAMATHGGVALFRRDYPLRSDVPIYTQIKLEQLNLRHTVRLVVADSGSRPPAITMISDVRRQYESDKPRVQKTFEAIDAILRNGKLALEQGNLSWLGPLLDMNHWALAGLMLVNDRVQQMVNAAKAAGALGAKMTGAGGGGCMIALVYNDEAHAAPVRAALAPFGTVFEVYLRSKFDELESKT
jgi:mevalonate kinase